MILPGGTGQPVKVRHHDQPAGRQPDDVAGLETGELAANGLDRQAQSRPLLNPGNHAQEWTAYVDRPITVRTVPGSHSSMLHKPHVEALAQDLQRNLDSVREARDAVEVAN